MDTIFKYCRCRMSCIMLSIRLQRQHSTTKVAQLQDKSSMTPQFFEASIAHKSNTKCHLVSSKVNTEMEVQQVQLSVVQQRVAAICLLPLSRLRRIQGQFPLLLRVVGRRLAQHRTIRPISRSQQGCFIRPTRHQDRQALPGHLEVHHRSGTVFFLRSRALLPLARWTFPMSRIHKRYTQAIV